MLLEHLQSKQMGYPGYGEVAYLLKSKISTKVQVLQGLHLGVPVKLQKLSNEGFHKPSSYFKYSVKKAPSLSKGITLSWSYRSVWLAPGISSNSLLSPVSFAKASFPK